MINRIANKNNKKKIKIDKCIYCGSIENLTDEHVFPLALNGSILLTKACCEPCREITSKCELNPLHENWIETRAYLNYASRKSNFDSKIFPLEVTLKDNTKKKLLLKRRETLGITQFLELAIPGFFQKSLYSKGSRVVGISNYGFGINLNTFVKKYNIKSFSFLIKHKNNYFETMLAKIAYCLTISTWGAECFSKNFVLPSILLEKDDIGRWVGCDPEGKILPLLGKQEGSNVGKVYAWSPKNSQKKYGLVRLKFFANTDAPEYIVVVGLLKDNFITRYEDFQ